MGSFVIIPGSADDVPGQVSINPRGKEAEERAKFEQFDTAQTRASGVTGHFRPGNPYRYREYPKMLYQAQENPHMSYKLMCEMPEPPRYNFTNDDQWQHSRDAAAAFNKACQRVVNDEQEEQAAKESGWRPSMKEALEAGKARQFANFKETGHREWDDRNMGELAKREKVAAEEAADGRNIPEIPRKPVSKADRSAAIKAGLAKRKAAIEAKKEAAPA